MRALTRLLRWFVTYAGIGITVSVVYLVFIVRFFVIGNSEIYYLTPNEIGDFLAGILGPLATFWLVLGFFQQGHELRNSTIALRQQSLEFAKTVRNQQAQIKYDLAFKRYQIEQVDRSTEPILELAVIEWHPAGDGGRMARLALRNFGATIASPSLQRDGRLVEKPPALSFGQEHRFELRLAADARERLSLSFVRIDGTRESRAWRLDAAEGAVAPGDG